MAISIKGVVHHKIQVGSFNREKFQEFIVELSTVLGDETFYFVMDNCAIHYGIFSDDENHNLVYLPPYSSFLNPIEAVFNCLRRKVEHLLADNSNYRFYRGFN